MDFKAYFFSLPVPARVCFAERCNTTRGFLTQVAYKNKRIGLGLADVICAQSGGLVDLDGLPLTDQAAVQRRQRIATRAKKPRLSASQSAG